MNVLKKIFPISGAFHKGAGKTAIGAGIYAGIALVALLLTWLLKGIATKVLEQVLANTIFLPFYIIGIIFYIIVAFAGYGIFMLLATTGVGAIIGVIIFIAAIIVGLIPILITNAILYLVITIIIAIPVILVGIYCLAGVIVSIVACVNHGKQPEEIAAE